MSSCGVPPAFNLGDEDVEVGLCKTQNYTDWLLSSAIAGSGSVTASMVGCRCPKSPGLQGESITGSVV